MVADVVAGGGVAVGGGVGEVGVRRLVGALVVGVRESVLAPVAVKHFGLVSVLVHIVIINYKINNQSKINSAPRSRPQPQTAH